MNDPEIIKKLDEIKRELSKINGHFTAIGIGFWILFAFIIIIDVVIPWIRDFLD